jgi:hypothetical protein
VQNVEDPGAELYTLVIYLYITYPSICQRDPYYYLRPLHTPLTMIGLYLLNFRDFNTNYPPFWAILFVLFHSNMHSISSVWYSSAQNFECNHIYLYIIAGRKKIGLKTLLDGKNVIFSKTLTLIIHFWAIVFVPFFSHSYMHP